MTSLLLASLAGLLCLLAAARVWRVHRGLALGMALFFPVGVYALARYWNERDIGIRLPMIAAIALAASSWILLARDVREFDSGAGLTIAEDAMPFLASRAPADDAIADKLGLSIALSALPLQGGRVEIPVARAAIEVPARFRFADREGLQALYEKVGESLPESSVGWLVHESVDLAAEDAWFVEVEWLGDGHVREDGFSDRTPEQLLADAREATDALSLMITGEGEGFRLVDYAEAPVLDTESDTATWVEELAYEGDREHRLDCYAAKLGRGGVLVFSILEVGLARREVCLRSVRLAAGRTVFDAGQSYDDHSWLFDRRARYDLAAVVSGAAALPPADR